MNLTELLSGFTVAMRVLQARLVLIITLVMTFALYAYAIVQPTRLGAMIAALWGLTIFLPVLFSGSRSSHVSEAPQQSEGDSPSS